MAWRMAPGEMKKPSLIRSDRDRSLSKSSRDQDAVKCGYGDRCYRRAEGRHGWQLRAWWLASICCARRYMGSRRGVRGW